jgi:hypothetical protein
MTGGIRSEAGRPVQDTLQYSKMIKDYDSIDDGAGRWKRISKRF